MNNDNNFGANTKGSFQNKLEQTMHNTTNSTLQSVAATRNICFNKTVLFANQVWHEKPIYVIAVILAFIILNLISAMIKVGFGFTSGSLTIMLVIFFVTNPLKRNYFMVVFEDEIQLIPDKAKYDTITFVPDNVESIKLNFPMNRVNIRYFGSSSINTSCNPGNKSSSPIVKFGLITYSIGLVRETGYSIMKSAFREHLHQKDWYQRKYGL